MCRNTAGLCLPTASNTGWSEPVVAHDARQTVNSAGSIGMVVNCAGDSVTSRPQFRRVLDLLEPEPAANDTAVGAVLHDVAERVRKRGLVVVISDLIDDVDK